MANSPQARKRARQNDKRHEHNMALRTKFRTFLKKAVAVIASGNKEEAKTAYQNAQKVIDGLSNKGLIHKNKAARHKKRLSQQIKQMA